MADPLQQAALQRAGARGADPGLLERLMAWFRSSGAQVQPASQDVAEGMNMALPDELSARPAIEEDRRRKAMIDEMLRNAR